MKTTGSRAFENASRTFFNSFLTYNPDFAIHWNIPGFEKTPIDFSSRAVAAELDADLAILRRLARVDARRLSSDAKQNYKIMLRGLELEVFDMEHSDTRALWSPTDYLPFDTLQILLDRAPSQLEEQLLFRMGNSVTNLAQAQRRLEEEVDFMPPEWVASGIAATEDGHAFFDELPTRREIQERRINGRVVEASKRLQESAFRFQDYLIDKLKPRAQGDFAVGEERFRMSLTHEHFLELEPEEIQEFGRVLYSKTKRQIRDLLADTKHDMKSYANVLAGRERSREKVMDYYRKHTQKSLDFLMEADIVPLGPEGELRVVNMPSYLNRIAPFAAYQLPQLLGEQVGHFFVNVFAQANLEEHSNAFIKNTVAHEGFPGHHLQFMLANQQAKEGETSRWARLFYESGSMYEGWAVYAEQLMVEQGFHNTRADKFAMLKDRLWRALRIELDVGMHTQGLTYDRAQQLMADKLGFSREAAGMEVDWYIESPGLPSMYSVGWQMINLLRDQERERLGGDFSLKDFHTKLLNQGSIALPLVIQREFGRPALDEVYRGFREIIN